MVDLCAHSSVADSLLLQSGDQSHTDQQRTKLFVGMAPKSAYEEDYRAVFAPFGTPIDIYVIRDRNGFSKGCAFVRYESAKSANDAIEALHDKHIMPGGFRTLVVTIADDRRGPQTGTATTTSTTRRDAGSSGGGLFRSLPRAPSFMGSDSGGGGSMSSVRSLTGPNRLPAPQAGVASFAPNVLPGDPSSGVVSGMPYFVCGGNPPQGTYVYYPYVPPSSSGHPDVVASSGGPDALGIKLHHAFPVGSAAGGNNNREISARRVLQEDGYAGDGKLRRFGSGGPEEKGRRWAKQPVGPTGANLFVYYLPGSLTDADLATAFAPFGEVLSAKVYYDRDTGESKGFGETPILPFGQGEVSSSLLKLNDTFRLPALTSPAESSIQALLDNCATSHTYVLLPTFITVPLSVCMSTCA